MVPVYVARFANLTVMKNEFKLDIDLFWKIVLSIFAGIIDDVWECTMKIIQKDCEVIKQMMIEQSETEMGMRL
jgi:hypothetical protein